MSVYRRLAGRRSSLRRVDKPNYERRNFILGVVGLTIAIVALPLWGGLLDRQGLQVLRFQVTAGREVPALIERTHPATGEVTRDPTESAPNSSFIDVTLRNDGDTPVLLTAADFVFERVVELGCGPTGGGVEIAIAYDVRVPAPTPSQPFTVTKSLSFEVAAGGQDRLGFTLGPEVHASYFPPYIYQVKLLLRQTAPDRTVEVGRAVVIEPAVAAEGLLDSYGEVTAPLDCARTHLQELDEFLSTDATPAPQVVAFRESLSLLVKQPPR